MPDKVKSSIEAINTLSRLLLSQFEMQAIALNDIKDTLSDTEQSILTDEQLLNLVDERNTLVNQLFTKYPQGELNKQLSLINEMVSLDGQLTSKSQHHKKVLAEKVIKLKKSKKVKNLYNKY